VGAAARAAAQQILDYKLFSTSIIRFKYSIPDQPIYAVTMRWFLILLVSFWFPTVRALDHHMKFIRGGRGWYDLTEDQQWCAASDVARGYDGCDAMVCLCEERQYIYDQTDSCVRKLDHPVGLQELWIVYNYNAVVSYIADFCSFEPALMVSRALYYRTAFAKLITGLRQRRREVVATRQ